MYIQQLRRIERIDIRCDRIDLIRLIGIKGLDSDDGRCMYATAEDGHLLLGVGLDNRSDLQFRRIVRQVDHKVRSLRHIQCIETVRHDADQLIRQIRQRYAVRESIRILRAVFGRYDHRRGLTDRCLGDGKRLLGFGALYRDNR